VIPHEKRIVRVSTPSLNTEKGVFRAAAAGWSQDHLPLCGTATMSRSPLSKGITTRRSPRTLGDAGASRAHAGPYRTRAFQYPAGLVLLGSARIAVLLHLVRLLLRTPTGSVGPGSVSGGGVVSSSRHRPIRQGSYRRPRGDGAQGKGAHGQPNKPSSFATRCFTHRRTAFVDQPYHQRPIRN